MPLPARPLHDLPKDWNPNIAEGRAARADGLAMVSPYGDSAAGREWVQGWSAEHLTSTVPLKIETPKVETPKVFEPKMVERATPEVGKVVAVGGFRRGPFKTSGRFETRDELEKAIMARASDDPAIIAADVGISLPTVLKIMVDNGHEVVKGKRGRKAYATGNFESREALEAAIMARSSDDARDIAVDVGVSLPTVLKIIAANTAQQAI